MKIRLLACPSCGYEADEDEFLCSATGHCHCPRCRETFDIDWEEEDE